MSSKTKIVVLHMKEIIYTVIFAVLAIVLILLLIFMFRPGHHSGSNDKKIYTPGIYTSDITLNNTALEVEVTVDETHINSIRFTNLNDPSQPCTLLSNRRLKILPNRSIKNSLLRIYSILPILLILPS